MTIKAKLLIGSIALSGFIAAIIALSLFTFGSLSDGFVEIINKSDAGVSNSRVTEESIVKANTDLSAVSQGMLAVSADINRTNMSVKILERKIKQLSGTLDEVAEEMEYVIEEMPEGSTRDDLEDVTDSVGDVKEAMRREALISLTSTVKKMDEFATGITVQVDSIRQLAEGLDKGAQLSAEVLTSNQEISLVSKDFSSQIGSSRNTIVAMLLGIAVLCLVATFLFSRSITHPLEHTVEIAQGIAAGDLNQTVDINRKDEIGQLASAMSVMIENLRTNIDETERRAGEATRIQQALDNVSGNVMVVDPDYNLIYVNQAVVQMFHDASAGLSQDLPGFDADHLLGQNLSVLQNPDLNASTLDNLSGPHSTEYEVGGHIFQVIANPVANENGQRLGTALEWNDRTQEVEVEKEIQAIVDGVISGDLSGRIEPADKSGFFLEFSEGVNSIVEKLCGTMLEIGESANAVRTGSAEIAQGNTNLSQRTEEQAASLEETASSMADMTGTVRTNAQNAVEATEVAAAAQSTAEGGGEVVGNAVTAMNEINASSKKISDIIGVIDEIAFQTNLLALNASVEAARAGEQGRGFAVVASEVRNLAGRSAAAAKEIKELIEDSVIKVETGTRLVDESGETLEDIVKGVRQVTAIVGEIAAASRTQSTGIDEVNKAIEQMDELTQQNAALVEEVAAASENMRRNASNLGTVVDGYKISRTGNESSGPAIDADAYDGDERREEDRPWADKPTHGNAEAEPASEVAAQGSGDWQTF